MKPVASDWTIVIVGNWNMAILNPDWVASEILEKEQVGIEALIGPGMPSYRYISDEFIIIPRPDRVTISSTLTTPASLNRVESLACTVLEKLPVTPISAIGVNFGYMEEEVIELAEIFAISDRMKIADAGLDVFESTIVRSMKFDEKMLNLRISQKEDGNIRIHLNYHKAVSSAEEASGYIRDKINDFRQHAENLLADVYNIELEEDQDG